MKRFLSILIAVLLIIALGAVAFAAQYDLAGYSTSDLIELRKQVDAELAKRLDGGVLVPSGTYYVGTDIDAGSYVLTAVYVDFLAGCNINDESGECITFETFDTGEQARISLREGMSFELYGSDFMIARGGKIIF